MKKFLANYWPGFAFLLPGLIILAIYLLDRNLNLLMGGTILTTLGIFALIAGYTFRVK